jgi:hypothetical protein
MDEEHDRIADRRRDVTRPAHAAVVDVGRDGVTDRCDMHEIAAAASGDRA